jgi:hypothetical protein
MSYYNVSLTPSFEILPTGRYNITLLFSVTNIADHDCWAYQHSLLQRQSLFKEIFKINNENGERASYSGMLVKFVLTLMPIKINETLNNESILTNSYDFPGGNEIYITYKDKIDCCPEPIRSDQCDSEIIEASTTLLVGLSLNPQEQIYYASYNEF